jgi:hypothetical protein
MPGYNLQRRGTVRTLPYLCCSTYCLFCVVLYFVCKCVLYNCHRVSTQLQLTNISYHIINNATSTTADIWTPTWCNETPDPALVSLQEYCNAASQWLGSYFVRVTTIHTATGVAQTCTAPSYKAVSKKIKYQTFWCR